MEILDAKWRPSVPVLEILGEKWVSVPKKMKGKKIPFTHSVHKREPEALLPKKINEKIRTTLKWTRHLEDLTFIDVLLTVRESQAFWRFAESIKRTIGFRSFVFFASSRARHATQRSLLPPPFLAGSILLCLRGVYRSSHDSLVV